MGTCFLRGCNQYIYVYAFANPTFFQIFLVLLLLVCFLALKSVLKSNVKFQRTWIWRQFSYFSHIWSGWWCIRAGFYENTIIKNFPWSLGTRFENMVQAFLIRSVRTPTCLWWFCFSFITPILLFCFRAIEKNSKLIL